ncbi:serine/threonine phosphatase [Aphelenchoides avenae]|nr:serine/threonine phosphatase [Aphelenchus avenae]
MDFIDSCITRLLESSDTIGHQPIYKTITVQEIIHVCDMARLEFQRHGPLVEINSPVNICGDVHGQYNDLIRLFGAGGFPPLSAYLFLGDYVDRGDRSVETILLLFCYKIRYPKVFFILRGNHECEHVNRIYGFYDECCRRFKSVPMWQAFQDTFRWMPLSALVGGRILCMHGGISPYLNSIDQLRSVQRPNEGVGGLAMDLLWADPVVGFTGFKRSLRGASYGFGPEALMAACNDLKIDLVARAHQVVQDGYEFFGGRRLVTIFSAPHYCGTFKNNAAMMHVDKNLVCSFRVLRPQYGEKAAISVATKNFDGPPKTNKPDSAHV